jgi:hypothetical protein
MGRQGGAGLLKKKYTAGPVKLPRVFKPSDAHLCKQCNRSQTVSEAVAKLSVAKRYKIWDLRKWSTNLYGMLYG